MQGTSSRLAPRPSLNAGMPPIQVAAWAGRSVGVLLQLYAKVTVGQEDAARRRIDVALGGPELRRVFGTDSR